MKSVRLAPEAVAELANAAAWYDGQRAGLGTELLVTVEAMLSSLTERADSFPRLLDVPNDLVLRRALLPRFPYGLVFLVGEAEVRVIAVAHLRRRPGYWLSRVRA